MNRKRERKRRNTSEMDNGRKERVRSDLIVYRLDAARKQARPRPSNEHLLRSDLAYNARDIAH